MTKKTTKPTQTDAVSRTSAGLRDALFDEIDAVRDGTSNPTRANAVAKLATGIADTVRMEIEVSKHMRGASDAVGSVAFAGQPAALQLGTA
jgi:hypothetical protein